MASTSTSSIQKSFKNDVFLSFRGEDTRNNFVSHLYKALVQNGIQTYKDDKNIEKGETIDTQLLESIEDSRFFIIVFSKDYAGSSWCLNELVKIMECRKASEQTAYPVFYDVEPTEIRKQSGAVKEAFRKHENKEAAGKWREALNEAGNLAGWESKRTANGDESKLIQIIVDDIFKKICPGSPSVDRNLVGMETRIEDFLSSLELDAHDVRMIGIWGMGGGGKITLATTIFHRICHQFEGSSLVDNVREVSNSSLSGLKELQKQILTDVFSDQPISVSSVSGGINKMVQMMHRKKVLVVLDDVNDTKQLEALAGASNWFKPGSRIIITTRDEQVLSAHKLNFNHNFILKVNLLSPTESICLFSRHAFGREIPDEGYEHLSRKVVQYAAGLPLTIKVLGSFLCSKEKPEWNDALERLKTIPLNKTMIILELSYKSLEDDYKDIFLDVACLLKGWYKKDAIRALESCGFRARIGLRVLEQRSLINISKVEKLGMHDHLVEMGKNIVRRENPNKPEKHSRLWIKEEIAYILANKSGTQATKCILWDAYGDGLNFGIFMNGLANMKELRFIQVFMKDVSDEEVSNWNFDEDSLHLPNALRFLSWGFYPFSSLPKTLQANNLVGLDMYGSRMVQLWKDGEEKPFLKLRFLKFTCSQRLRTLDLSVAPNLETLILESCWNLVEVHFRDTPNLKELRIKYCWRLEKLHMPAECPNLGKLSLLECPHMVELHMPAEWPKLIKLKLSNLKLRTLHLRITPNLGKLSLLECTDMVELHMPAKWPKLIKLKLSNLKLRALHLGITPNLETLSLSFCTDMVKLHMPAECPKLVTIDLNNNAKLRTLVLGLTPNLERLTLKNCFDLEEINAPAECLKKLLYLYISHCGRFESFKFDKELDSPEVVSLSELYLKAVDTGISDPGNTWPEFKFCCYYKEDPVSSFGNLERLISLGIGARINVDSFSDIICGLQCLRKLTLKGGIPKAPKNLDRLDCLEELSLRSTDIKNLPDSLCMLKHLKSLEIISCRLLEKLPEDIGRLQCLEKLIVKDCISLRDIPNCISCEMHRLEYLDLTDCIHIEEWPEEIGRLECLKELDITGINRLPQSIFQLKGLNIRGSTKILEYGDDDTGDDFAGKWRDALKEAAILAGWESKETANGDESKLIQEIVDVVVKKKCSSSSSVDENLVGMETRIEAFISSLELDADDVRMIGIWGMGGGGKTTLARAVFDRISIQFDGKTFVENVREVSKSSLYGLNKLQQQILHSVLSDENIPERSVHEGTKMMKTLLRGRKVLIVLDDVDDREQLEALASEPDWFKFGSRVIITTRDKQVLSAHGVKFINDINLLSPAEAICLLSKYAFARDIPIKGYEELSKEVVQYAAGLPLTIKVLGSLLCGQNWPQWKDTLERLKKIPLEKTMEKLELSYDGLDEDFKEIFLDVACMLKGWRKDDAIRALQSCGFHARVGLKVLRQKSLITISEYGELDMHNHIEEMGKNIVRRLNPHEPEWHSRLWIDEEIVDILANDSGTQATKCLTLNTYSDGLNFEILMNGLANMKELRFLHVHTYGLKKELRFLHVHPYRLNCDEVSNWSFDEVDLYLPNALRFLRWVYYPFSSLPKTFHAKNLVVLEMAYSKIVQLWKDGEKEACLNLRFLKFTDCDNLRTLDLSVAPNLETLTLEDCEDLVEVHFQVTPKLEELRINQCERLEKLHLGNNTKLRTLDLGNNTKLRTLDLGLSPNLLWLYLDNCYDLEEINAPAECLKNILQLNISHCGRFKSFKFDKEPYSLEVVSLSELHVIAEADDADDTDDTVDADDLDDADDANDTGVCDPGNTWSEFRFTCYYKEDPASSFGNLERLISLGFGGRLNVDSFADIICGLQCLRKLTLEGGIPEAPKNLDRLDCLEELSLRSTDIKALPDSICLLKHLKSLEIISCCLLEKLPKYIGRLQCLEKLIVKDCILLRDIPNSICEMHRLECLDLTGCIRIEEFPEEIGRLDCLKKLDITGTGITRLTKSIYQLLRIIDDENEDDDVENVDRGGSDDDDGDGDDNGDDDDGDGDDGDNVDDDVRMLMGMLMI